MTQKQRQSQTKIADALFSKLVRSVGYCEMAGAFGIACNGNLQCSHIFGRGARILRFERINAICACAAHHMYTTHHPYHFEDWCREQLGDAVYDELHPSPPSRVSPRSNKPAPSTSCSSARSTPSPTTPADPAVPEAETTAQPSRRRSTASTTTTAGKAPARAS